MYFPDSGRALAPLQQGNEDFRSRFGDLTRLGSVRINRDQAGRFPFVEYDPTSIHLTVTGRCNARCKGCINAAITVPYPAGSREKSAPVADTDPKRDAAAILNLLRQHPGKDGVVCFYGGEPLLAPAAILEVMDRIEAEKRTMPVRYMLYTNGDLLEKTADRHPDLIERLWLLSVSIDGRADQHERVRPGTRLARIHQGLSAIKPLCRATVLMWSTLREEQSLADCFDEFMTLHGRGLVRQFFWHWVETVEPFADFAGFAARYDRDFSRIMDIYVDRLQQGVILPLVHVNELVLFILTGVSRNSSGCGVELAGNYDLIDGKIHSCADLPPELAIGSINADGTLHFHPHDLLPLVSYKRDLGCGECGVHSYCGGRCPVQAKVGTALRLAQYCQLMRLHVAIVLERLGKIMAAVKRQGLSAQRFYDDSAVYAQFTDVTP